MTRSPSLIAILGISILTSCAQTRVRYLDENTRQSTPTEIRLDQSDRAYEQAVAALVAAIDEPVDEPVYFALPDEYAFPPAEDLPCVLLPRPSDRDLPLNPRVDDVADPGDGFRAFRRKYLGFADFIDDIDPDDLLGIDGWVIKPNQVTLRLDLGDGWRLDLGYGRHVKGTQRTYAGLVDHAMREAAVKARELPGRNSFGFSFVRSLR